MRRMRKPSEIILKNGKTLETVLAEHNHWFYEDCEGWEFMRACLSEADLSNADLSNADLSNADLSNADLRGAHLRGADLRGADLHGADLSEACLNEADLQGACLNEACLNEADLRRADLSYSNLSLADLRGADLCNADLSEADIHCVFLSNAKNVPYIPYSCPDYGSFIGYKRAQHGIVELLILDDARRSSSTGRICRCDKAKVLGIYDDNHNLLDIKETKSKYDHTFVYEVGKIVEEPNFCEDRWKECSPGIHFFINFQEAVNY